MLCQAMEKRAMSEQIKSIELDVRTELDGKMPVRIKEIKKWLIRNREQWEKGMSHTFEELFRMGEEKEVSYLQICFLRTSLLSCQYFYRACLYDGLYYLDQEPVWVDVDTRFVYQFFQEDIQEFKQKLERTYKHIYPNDAMRIKELCNFYYIGLMKVCVESVLPGFLKTKAYTELRKAESFKILFGEYMGKAEVIYELFYSHS